MNVKQVIVIRKDIKMRRGKEIAQGSHGSMAWMSEVIRNHTRDHQDSCVDYLSNGYQPIDLTPEQNEWLINGLFTKIVTQVDSEAELMSVFQAATDAGLTVHLITDAGLTEFNGVPTRTCLAIGPNKSEEIDKITGHLKLY